MRSPFTPTCQRCPFQDVYLEDIKRAANDNHKPGTCIRIPTDAVLQRPAVVHRLAIAVRNLGIARRSVPDFIEEAVRTCPVQIMTATGSEVCRCSLDVDAAFNDDGSYRWISDFLSFADSRPKQKAQTRTIKRLQLIYLALAIQFPGIAEGVLA